MKAILVDLDGTLVDSHEANLLAYSAALRESGLDFDPILLEALIGQFAWPSMLSKVVPSHKELYPYILKRKREIFIEMMPRVKINELLVRFLIAQKSLVPIGLVTSASKKSTITVIEKKSLVDIFSVIVTSDDVSKYKPDPEPYHRAASLLRVAPTDCLVFEDSDTGVAAAKAFGAQVWKVIW